jgi:sugar lactone lactonase YvrE
MVRVTAGAVWAGLAAVLAGVVWLLIGPLCPIHPIAYTLDPLPTLPPNDRLVNAQHLFVGDWYGPESLAIDAQNRLYTGLGDGRVVRWGGQEGSGYEVFAHTGEVLSGCGSYGLEPRCGRPLGLHFDKAGNLLVSDAYKGLLSINGQGVVKVLATAAGGEAFSFTNDLAISPIDGTIYFTDSGKIQRRDVVLEVVEGGEHGRLLAYHPSNGSCEVVLSGLAFANGLTLHHDNHSVLINELSRYRIRRYYFAGPKAGKSEIWAENLPGTNDNIRPVRRGQKQHYLVGMGARRAAPFSLIQLLAPFPKVRSLLAALLPQEFIVSFIPAWGLVVELDEEGRLVDTWQDPSGRTAWISEALEWKGYLYLGSFRNPFLGRIPIDEKKS